MDNNENRMITPWGYIGYSLLFAIPIVGLICAIVFAFSSTYPCRKNYARSFLIVIIITIVVSVVLSLVAGDWYRNILYNYANYRYY